MLHVLPAVLCCMSLVSAPFAQVADSQNPSNLVTSSDEIPSPFSLICTSGTPQKILDCDDGYVYYNLWLYKAPFTDISSLYLAKFSTSFTPGHVAKQNNSKKPDGNNYNDYYLKLGYFHVELRRYEVSGKKGGTIYPMEGWPHSSSFTTTISTSVSISNTISNAFSNEVKIGDEVSLSKSKTDSRSLNFSYTKTTSTTSPDPIISDQFSPTNDHEYQWYYKIQDEQGAGSVTYHMDTYYLFEMSNIAMACDVNSMYIILNVRMTNQFKGFLGIWYEGKDYYGSRFISRDVLHIV